MVLLGLRGVLYKFWRERVRVLWKTMGWYGELQRRIHISKAEDWWENETRIAYGFEVTALRDTCCRLRSFTNYNYA